MRTIDPGLDAHLRSGATTLARCWRLTRRDTQVFGFTEHDRDLAFDGCTFVAATGMDGGAVEHELGLAVGGGEIRGALNAAAIGEADVMAGLWDGAKVETWLVNWSNVSERLLLDTGVIGDITRTDGVFRAEVRGLAQELDEERGRIYSAGCSAVLGDAWCRVDLGAANRRLRVTITRLTGANSFEADNVAPVTAGDFNAGSLRVLTGPSAGDRQDIMTHGQSGTTAQIALWQPFARAISEGTEVELTVGCDKSYETCRRRFNNGANFRGFPHIPGNDFVVSYARRGDGGMDGEPFVP